MASAGGAEEVGRGMGGEVSGAGEPPVSSTCIGY